MTDPFSGKAFETAAYRRGGRGLAFQVRTYIYDDDGDPRDCDGDGNPVATEVLLRVDPRLDMLRFGALFGGLGKMFGALGSDAATMDEARLTELGEQMARARDKMRDCLTVRSRDVFDRVADSIDYQTIMGFVNWLTGELTGMDPTERGSSSDGLPATTSSSTDGAPPAV